MSSFRDYLDRELRMDYVRRKLEALGDFRTIDERTTFAQPEFLSFFGMRVELTTDGPPPVLRLPEYLAALAKILAPPPPEPLTMSKILEMTERLAARASMNSFRKLVPDLITRAQIQAVFDGKNPWAPLEETPAKTEFGRELDQKLDGLNKIGKPTFDEILDWYREVGITKPELFKAEFGRVLDCECDECEAARKKFKDKPTDPAELDRLWNELQKKIEGPG